jgi:hypothetical protein
LTLDTALTTRDDVENTIGPNQSRIAGADSTSHMYGAKVEDASLRRHNGTLLSPAMILLILTGLVYAVWFDSLTVAILTASLVYYRAHRPGKLMQRIREWNYQRQAAQIGEVE